MKNLINKITAIFMMFVMACGGAHPEVNIWREKYRVDNGSTAAYKVDLINSEIEIPLNINLAALTRARRTQLEQSLATGNYSFGTEIYINCRYNRAPNVRSNDIVYGALGPRDISFSLSQGRVYFDANSRLYTLVKFIPRTNGKVWYNDFGNDTTGELIACLTERTNEFVYKTTVITYGASGTNGSSEQTFEFVGSLSIYFNPLH